MKSLATTAAVTAALALSVSAAQAGPSAKFAANWEADKVTLIAISSDNHPDFQTPVAVAEELLTRIKVPNQKELLIGVSGVANLVTFTEAKGKNGEGTSTAIAEGTMSLAVKYGPEGSDVCASGTEAAPGAITFASRRQELSVTTNLNLTGDVYDGDGNLISISGDVTVALGLDTTAAHHFNFVALDLSSGTYDVKACFDATALISPDGSVPDVDEIARSKVAIAHRMITVQQVRAVKDAPDGILEE